MKTVFKYLDSVLKKLRFHHRKLRIRVNGRPKRVNEYAFSFVWSHLGRFANLLLCLSGRRLIISRLIKDQDFSYTKPVWEVQSPLYLANWKFYPVSVILTSISNIFASCKHKILYTEKKGVNEHSAFGQACCVVDHSSGNVQKQLACRDAMLSALWLFSSQFLSRLH